MRPSQECSDFSNLNAPDPPAGRVLPSALHAWSERISVGIAVTVELE
jgi:hypothetical protein